MQRYNVVGCILGRKGSGKSTLARRIVANARRCVVLDWLAEYGEAEGCDVVVGLPACVDALERHARNTRVKLSLRCERLDDFRALLRIVATWSDVLVVVEEASRYCSPHALPDELEILIRYGRHRGQDQLYLARRPAELHRDLTANADYVATFRQWEPRDLVYMRALCGDDGLRAADLEPFRVLVTGTRAAMPLSVLASAQFVVDTTQTPASVVPHAAPGD